MINLWSDTLLKTKQDYSTSIKFKIAINLYFESCFEGTSKTLKFRKVPSISGLCKYLSIGKEEFNNMANNPDKQYGVIINDVLLTIEEFMINELVINKNTNIKYILDSLGFGDGGTTDTNLTLEL